MSAEDITKSALRVVNFNATAFVVFSDSVSFKNMAAELNRQNVTDKVWIASEAWATSTKTFKEGGRFNSFKIRVFLKTIFIVY